MSMHRRQDEDGDDAVAAYGHHELEAGRGHRLDEHGRGVVSGQRPPRDDGPADRVVAADADVDRPRSVLCRTWGALSLTATEPPSRPAAATAPSASATTSPSGTAIPTFGGLD